MVEEGGRGERDRGGGGCYGCKGKGEGVELWMHKRLYTCFIFDVFFVTRRSRLSWTAALLRARFVAVFQTHELSRA